MISRSIDIENSNPLEMLPDANDQEFGVDVEDTTGGAITLLLVVFALIAVGLVVYSVTYPPGTLTSSLQSSLDGNYQSTSNFR